MEKKQASLNGLKDGIPICLGYISVSFTFGMMTAENGLPCWIALLISMTNLTSAGQFAGTALILSGSAFLEIAVTTFVINIRYMLMSLSIAQKADPAMTTWQRMLLSFGITDEIFAISAQHTGLITAPYLAGLILPPYCGWVLGTLLGSTATSLLPAEIRNALGIAIYGMFFAILIPPAKKVRSVAITIVLAAVVSCVFRYTPVLSRISSGWVIILCAIIAAGYSALRYPVSEKEEGKLE